MKRKKLTRKQKQRAQTANTRPQLPALMTMRNGKLHVQLLTQKEAKQYEDLFTQKRDYHMRRTS